MSSSPQPSAWRLGTRCVHAGHRPNLAHPAARSLAGPIVRGTAFLLDDEAYALRAAGRSTEAWIYGREKSPTVEDVERRLAALDGAERALVFGSGLAAMHALLMARLARGDRLLAARQLYGGTLGLLRELLPRMDVGLDLFDVTRPDEAAAALTERTALVFCESVSNPTLEVADVRALARLAHEHGALLAIDATFATPIAQRPLELGADLVHHSASKYLGGHDDLLAGVVCGSAEALAPVQAWRTRTGATLDPEAAFLLDRGLKTLHLRMAAHTAGAGAVAERLAAHPRVHRVLYPGRPDHPTHATAAEQLELAGGMVAFVVAGGDAAALRVARALELFVEAGTLGGVESLVSVPAAMSHVSLSPEERLAAGIEPGLVRLSVGIEDPADLIADLESALGA